MGDLGIDTAVEGGDGHYTARFSEDWNIWGPNGGYVIAVALRAAGAHSRFGRPASLACHLLGVAAFDTVDLEVTTVKGGRRSESLRVSMTQGGKPICETMVWAVDDTKGLEHDWTETPEVARPEDTPTIVERVADESLAPPVPFWNNLEFRPLGWLSPAEFEAQRPHRPAVEAWFRFVPTDTFDDPWTDAGRAVVLLDVGGWPAGSRAMAPEQQGRWMAPNMDLSVAFHQSAQDSPYLLSRSEAPLATGGLIGARGDVWSQDGRLVATGTQQMLCREIG